MDILIKLRDFYINLVYSLPEGLTSFILRMGVLLILSLSLLSTVWIRFFKHRAVFLQVCLAFLTIVASLYFPVNMFREPGKEYLAFSVAIGLLCIIFLPGYLPAYLTPRLGSQIRLKKVIRNIIWGLFILQLILG